MKIINFIKDFIARKKLFRYNYTWKNYDLKYELARFWDTPSYMPENSNKKQYEQLVAVNGFYSSGSSAVLGFLAEFDDCTSPSGAKYPKEKIRNKTGFECLFWAEHASVLSLEENIFGLQKMHLSRKGALEFSVYVLRNFLNNIYIYDDYYLQRSKKFLFDLIECHWRYSLSAWCSLGSNKLYNSNNLPQRIQRDNPFETQIVDVIWKNFTKEEYRLKAKEYLKDFLKHIPSNKFLICDQLLHGEKFDYKLIKDYFDNIKIIYVYRDPRDQYVEHIEKHYDFISLDVDIFIKRYKIFAKEYFLIKHNDILLIRFEELVENYDVISEKIMNFLGLDRTAQSEKFKYFNPKIGMKNIGKYKTFHNQEAIKKIENELSEYCWNK